MGCLARQLKQSPKRSFMKDHIHFFIIFTLLEIALTVLYYLLVKTVDLTIAIGGGLYGLCMVAGYLSYRDAAYKKHRQQLLDALL